MKKYKEFLAAKNKELDAATTPEQVEEIRSAIKDRKDQLDIEAKKEEVRGFGNSFGSEFDVVATYTNTAKDEKRADGNKEVEEFRKYLETGEVTRAQTATESGVLIPNTIIDKIENKLRLVSDLYSRVTKSNIQGGVDYPVEDLVPTARWVGEATATTFEKATAKKVSFKYFEIEAAISVTYLAHTVGLDKWEDQFVDLLVRAIVEKVEESILVGTGVGQMLGVAKDTDVATLTGELSLPGLRGVKGKLGPQTDGGVFVGTEETFQSIQSLADVNGQPIARVNAGIDGADVYRVLGIEYVVVGSDVMTAAAFDLIFFLPEKYVINSNQNITVERWRDQENRQVKTRAIAIFDGKLINKDAAKKIKLTAALKE